MDIRATWKPGTNGTKGLVREYGEQLVCVRYRYDRIRRKRYKTVELILDAHVASRETYGSPRVHQAFRRGHRQASS